jgi:hypothetical protein
MASSSGGIYWARLEDAESSVDDRDAGRALEEYCVMACSVSAVNVRPVSSSQLLCSLVWKQDRVREVSMCAEFLNNVHVLPGACFLIFLTNSGTASQFPSHRAASSC